MRAFLSVAGKLLISMGIGVLLFVAWTLWGTGLYTRQQQQRLAQEFDRMPAFRVEAPEEQAPIGGPPRSYKPPPGAPVFKMRIPEIDQQYVVVEGVGSDELTLGPGHYPSCRPGFEPPLCTPFEDTWPGERGRVIVSGHRTTYDAPFYDLDLLERGDDIIVETKWNDEELVYEVTRVEIVRPDSRAIVVEKDGKRELVLTTCNPKYSAEQRLIVFAEMSAA